MKKEWTQKEYLQHKRDLEKEGVAVILVDTILSPIEKAQSVVYNPHKLKEYPSGTVFVFYCDSGKSTLERLAEFQAKFPENPCVSLRGGRGYWRKNMELLDDN